MQIALVMWCEPEAGLLWVYSPPPVSTISIRYWQIHVSNANVAFWFLTTLTTAILRKRKMKLIDLEGSVNIILTFSLSVFHSLFK